MPPPHPTPRSSLHQEREGQPGESPWGGRMRDMSPRLFRSKMAEVTRSLPLEVTLGV